MSERTSYDDLPYPSAPRPESHPDRLATIAALSGLAPAPVERCRVLELGCADGGNLIPMAYGLPGSELVGIDLSSTQIAAANETVAALGLKNISLRRADILDLGADLGTFDYIVIHGVLSWVPRPVQEKVLELCALCLAPHGIAYVSYNALPGWRFRGIFRDILLEQADPALPPRKRIAAGRARVEALGELVTSLAASGGGPATTAYATLFRSEVERTRRIADANLFHDHLEEVNEAFYFADVVARARRHGLEYLAEADFRDRSLDGLPPEAAARLRALGGDEVEREQALDVARNRAFRQTLLCRAGRVGGREIDAARLRDLFVSARAAEAPAGAPTLVGAAFAHLARIYPGAARFVDLVALGGPGAARDAEALATAVLRGYGLGLVELQLRPPAFAVTAGERPVASALARLEATRGPMVTSLRHRSVWLDGPASIELLGLLDGTRDRTELREITGTSSVALDRRLGHLAQAGLLLNRIWCGSGG